MVTLYYEWGTVTNGILMPISPKNPLRNFDQHYVYSSVTYDVRLVLRFCNNRVKKNYLVEYNSTEVFLRYLALCAATSVIVFRMRPF